MSDKLNILVDKSFCGPLSFLDLTKYNIFTDIKTLHIYQTSTNDGIVIHCNMDFVIDVCFNLPRNIIEQLGHRYIDQRRTPKSLMMTAMTQRGIFTPNFTNRSTVDFSIGWDSRLLSDMSVLGVSEALLKIEDGARNLGQLLISDYNVSPLYSLICQNSDERACDYSNEIEKLCTVFGDERITNEKYAWIAKLFDGVNNYTVQEYFRDIKLELRVLLFLDETDDKVVNRNHDSDTVYDYKEDTYITTSAQKKIEDTIQLLRKLLLAKGHLFISADIYIRGNGEVGVFEYSTEYGYVKVPSPHTLVNSTNRSLDMLIQSRLELNDNNKGN